MMGDSGIIHARSFSKQAIHLLSAAFSALLTRQDFGLNQHHTVNKYSMYFTHWL